MKGCGVMPREQINYPEAKKFSSESPDGQQGSVGFRTAPVLHVSWMPGAHAQVAFEADLNYLRVALDSPNETGERSSIYTDVLTRAEINKMIKALRRARDSAYGRDE